MAKSKAPDLGELIDAAYALRNRRLEMDRESAKLKEEETGLKEDIAGLLRAAKLESAKGKAATASFKRSIVANVVDEEVFLKWASKAANRDVLKVGVVLDAWRARRMEGVAVPGTEPFAKEELTLNKAGA